MRIIGNLLWWIFGGLEAAFVYLTGSLVLALTIVGIPFALQTIKLGILCLWPFGGNVYAVPAAGGCLSFFMNLLWLLCGGLLAWLIHIFFGIILFITIIGIPFAKQHFKMAGLALAPFGREVNLNL